MRVLDEMLPGCLLIEALERRDQRGLFVRSFCAETFEGLGIDARVAQANLSRTTRRHTLRGLHYQLPPSAETKTVSCLMGAVFDVVVDLRPDSPTFRRWQAVELSHQRAQVLVVPPGCAHGFMSLTDSVLIHYLVSAPYDPQAERGVRWNDPTFAIRWPAEPRLVSERDGRHPDFDPAHHLA